jgi:hypothetical protein
MNTVFVTSVGMAALAKPPGAYHTDGFQTNRFVLTL